MAPERSAAIRVFLVDDHRTTLWGLERLIESAAPRMEVVGTACCRAEMVARAPATRPDVIVMDLDLGGEDGLDSLPELMRECEAHVLVLTGARSSDTHEKAMLSGARGVVQKAMSAEALLDAIDRVCAGGVWVDDALVGRVLGRLTDPRRTARPDPVARRIASLTARELEIIAAVVRDKGARNKVIAAHLHMSEHTLRNHLSAIYDKLDLGGRLELFVFATEHGLVRRAA
jgi:DNA-binding NarL/FixJ family response regulator